MDTQKVIEAIEEAGYEAETEYSGRAMYGKTCVSVEFERESEAFAMFAALGEIDGQLAGQMAAGARTDSMGCGMVVYWPTAKTEQAA